MLSVLSDCAMDILSKLFSTFVFKSSTREHLFKTDAACHSRLLLSDVDVVVAASTRPHLYCCDYRSMTGIYGFDGNDKITNSSA